MPSDTLEAVRVSVEGYSAAKVLKILEGLDAADKTPIAWTDAACVVSLAAATITHDAEMKALQVRELKARIIACMANTSASAAETIAGRDAAYIEAKRALASARLEASVAHILARALAVRAGISTDGGGEA